MLKTITVLVLLIISTYTDLKTNKIKNKVILPFIICGYIYQAYIGHTLLPTEYLIGLVLPLMLIPAFALNMLGAGDIKLFMATGIWLGWHSLLNVMVYSVLVGGIVALILIVMRKNGVKRLKYFFTYLKSCIIAFKPLSYQAYDDANNDGRFPFATVILIGYLSSLVLDRIL